MPFCSSEGDREVEAAVGGESKKAKKKREKLAVYLEKRKLKREAEREKRRERVRSERLRISDLDPEERSRPPVCQHHKQIPSLIHFRTRR